MKAILQLLSICLWRNFLMLFDVQYGDHNFNQIQFNDTRQYRSLKGE
jgi:hypothetical protein